MLDGEPRSLCRSKRNVEKLEHREAPSSPSNPPLKRPRARDAAHYVHIPRPTHIQDARLNLPVCMHEQEIVEAIRSHDVVVVTGATGSGKTTQVPQFLLEAGFGDATSPRNPGCVAVTQPRRVAAIACASRVATEVCTPVGKMVGFHVRHRPAFRDETRVKFLTDGILLQEVQADLYLRRYSCVVIDEAHERTLNTDLLLALLSRTVQLRRKDPGVSTGASGCAANSAVKLEPFKLIVMSATLDMDGIFTGPGSLFPSAPVVNVPARQHPVTVHFARRTLDDYLSEAVRKVRQIHKRLPPGGVLVFLTGRQEVEDMCSKLSAEMSESQVAILPFYALLDDRRQQEVFRDCGSRRKIVVATNVAETSVTIPGISYVVDSGRAKEKVYRGSGAGLLSSFDIVWISKASAEQRAGRSGRTGPGHCYRLYSSAIYNDHFETFRVAEIRRIPADSVVLRLRSMGIRHLDQFPFPTAPDKDAIQAAEGLLNVLGALSDAGKVSSVEMKGSVLGVTPIGLALAKLPAPPRFGRMLLAASAVPDCLPYAARAAAILSLGDVLSFGDKDAKRRHAPFAHPASDILTSVRALCAVEHSGYVASLAAGRKGGSKFQVKAAVEKAMKEFCVDYSLNIKTCVEALNVAQQLEAAVLRAVAGERPEDVEEEEEGGDDEAEEDPSVITKRSAPPTSRYYFKALAPMGKDVENGLMRSFLCGFPDQVARRMTIREAGDAGVIPRRRKIAFTTCDSDEPVFLGSFGSVLLEEEHDFVCYAEVVEVSRRVRKDPADRDVDIDDYVDDAISDSCDEVGDDKSIGGEANGGVAVADGVVVAASGGAATSTRRVLRFVTCVQPRWLQVDARAMCTIVVAPKSGILNASSSNGVYESRTDRVIRLGRARYGRRGWAVGSTPVNWNFDEHMSGSEASTVFAGALVCGEVVSGLGAGKGVASAGSGRVATLGRLFWEKRVLCKSDLLKLWRVVGKEFARAEFASCFGHSVRADALQKWDRMATVAETER